MSTNSTAILQGAFLFTGRRLDLESQAVYFRARSYLPHLGRFTSRDPSKYIDGMSLSAAYFAQRLQVDPSGKGAGVLIGGAVLTAAEIEAIIAAAIAATAAAGAIQCLDDPVCAGKLEAAMKDAFDSMSHAAKLALLLSCKLASANYKIAEKAAAGCNCDKRRSDSCVIRFVRCHQAFGCIGFLETLRAVRIAFVISGCDAAFEWETPGSGKFRTHSQEASSANRRLEKCFESVRKNCPLSSTWITGE